MPDEKLLCLDFDMTLVNGHFHSTLNAMKIQPHTREPGVQIRQDDGSFLRVDPKTNQFAAVPPTNGANPNVINSLISDRNYGPKNRGEMADAIRTAIDNGHKVAIVSFTLYPEVAAQTLKAILDPNSEKYLKEICIVGGFPSDNNPDNTPLGKEEHINAALWHFKNKGVIIDRKDAILVDDTSRNLDIAKQYGNGIVQVPKYPDNHPQHNRVYIDDIKRYTSMNVRAQVQPTNQSSIQPATLNVTATPNQPSSTSKPYAGTKHAVQYSSLPPTQSQNATSSTTSLPYAGTKHATQYTSLPQAPQQSATTADTSQRSLPPTPTKQEQGIPPPQKPSRPPIKRQEPMVFSSGANGEKSAVQHKVSAQNRVDVSRDKTNQSEMNKENKFKPKK